MKLPLVHRNRRRAVTPLPPSVGHTASSSGGSASHTPRSAVHEVRSRRADRGAPIFPRRKRPAALVRRLVLLGVITLCLTLITVTARTDALAGPRGVMLHALAPIETGLSRAWAPIAGAWDWCARLIHATSENAQLQDQVDELESQTAVSRTIEEENQRLRQALYLTERGRFPAGYRNVLGSVIARSPTDIDRSITIDLGTEDGLAVNDPVMVTRGLIGRVEAVSSNAARVGLIINPAQAVSVKVVDSSAAGVLHASTTEGSPVMELSYVTQRVSVKSGDLVVTSGWTTDGGNLQSIYPAGVPIGVVSSVGNSPADLYKTVQVTPFADFDRIETVIVLVAKTATRSTSSFDTPESPSPASIPVPSKVVQPAAKPAKVKRRSRAKQGDSAR